MLPVKMRVCRCYYPKIASSNAMHTRMYASMRISYTRTFENDDPYKWDVILCLAFELQKNKPNRSEPNFSNIYVRAKTMCLRPI